MAPAFLGMDGRFLEFFVQSDFSPGSGDLLPLKLNRAVSSSPSDNARPFFPPSVTAFFFFSLLGQDGFSPLFQNSHQQEEGRLCSLDPNFFSGFMRFFSQWFLEILSFFVLLIFIVRCARPSPQD